MLLPCHFFSESHASDTPPIPDVPGFHVPQLIRLETPFAEATINSLLAAVTREFGPQAVQLEFRRGILDGDMFGAGILASPEQLTRIGHRRLAEFGLAPRDRIVVRASGPSRLAHLCFHATHRNLS